MDKPLNKIAVGAATSLVVLAITTFISMGYYHVEANEVVAEMALQNQVALQSLECVPEQLSKIQGQLGELVKEVTTKDGKALVGNFGHDEGYIQINLFGQAAKYAEYNKARVTNLTNPSHPSYILPVKGTFSDPDSMCLIRVSAKAAHDMLETDNGSFRVRLERIYE
jgi:hypothetical protein